MHVYAQAHLYFYFFFINPWPILRIFFNLSTLTYMRINRMATSEILYPFQISERGAQSPPTFFFHCGPFSRSFSISQHIYIRIIRMAISELRWWSLFSTHISLLIMPCYAICMFFNHS